MSAFARQWDARIALSTSRSSCATRVRGCMKSYAPGALRGWSEREIPVCINHDRQLHVGFVDVVIQHDGWHVAAFRLDRSLPGSEVAAEYVKPGGWVCHSLAAAMSPIATKTACATAYACWKRSVCLEPV